MRQVVVLQIAASQDGVDELETGRRAVAHSHRHRAIQLDYRRRVGAQQDVVESDDLAPVRGVGSDRVGVHRRDRRLQRIGAEAPRGKRVLHQSRSFRDLRPVPERAVLVTEQDQLARGRGPRRASRFLQQHQRQQSDRLGLRQQFDEQPTETYRLAGQIDSRQQRA